MDFQNSIAIGPETLPEEQLQIQTIRLENLLNDFYAPSSSNDRKKEIETELMVFNDVNTYLQLIMYNLDSVSNTYVWYFKASCLEKGITSQIQDKNKRKYINDTLWHIYKEIPINAPTIQRDKLALLLVLLMKHEWTCKFVFLEIINHLIETKFVFGIVLLRTMSEELFSPRSSLLAVVKEQLITVLSSHMTNMFVILDRNLESLDYRTSNNVSAGIVQNNEMIVLLLSSIQHLFTWVDLEMVLTSKMLQHLFSFSHTNYSTEISITSLSTISELFYRQSSWPANFYLLYDITDLIEFDNLNKASEEYLEKLLELLTLFSTHFSHMVYKLENGIKFLINLYAIMTHTHLSGNGIDFSKKLAVWRPFVKTSHGKSDEYDEIKIMIKLAEHILSKKLFFIPKLENESEFVMLDNNTLDEDMKTEWQNFVTPCINYIISVAEGFGFNQIAQMILSVMDDLNDCNLDFLKWSNSEVVCKMLRSTSTLCQMISAMTNILNTNADQKSVSYILYKKFVECLTKLAIDLTQCNASGIIQIEIDFLMVQCLTTLQNLYCLSSFSSRYNMILLIEEIIKNIFSNPSTPISVQLAGVHFLLIVGSFFKEKFNINPEIIQLLKLRKITIGPYMKGDVLLNPKSIPEVQLAIMLHQAVCHNFLQPIENIIETEQSISTKKINFSNYISEITIKLQTDDLCDEHINETIPILTEILDFFAESNSTFKQFLKPVFQFSLEKVVGLIGLNNIQNVTTYEVILRYILIFIKTLQGQLEYNFVQQMFDFIITSVLSKPITLKLVILDRLLRILIQVIEKPGNISQSVLPSTLKLALDHVFPLLSSEQNNDKNLETMAVSFYALLDCILQNKWFYFYKSRLQITSISSIGNLENGTNNETILNHDDFIQIFHAYGYGLLSLHDPEIKQQILNSMQCLNERKKLYHREVFRTELLLHFLSAILKTLLCPEGVIQRDLLITVLFTMGQVDNTSLKQVFQETGYSFVAVHWSSIFEATDLPTFSEKMNGFVQDVKVYSSNY